MRRPSVRGFGGRPMAEPPGLLYSEPGGFPGRTGPDGETHMTTTAKLRWGILGVARINDRLLPGFARAARADLRAIASRSPDRAREAARAAGIATAHGSYEELLADPGIDAVYIPLPN